MLITARKTIAAGVAISALGFGACSSATSDNGAAAGSSSPEAIMSTPVAAISDGSGDIDIFDSPNGKVTQTIDDETEYGTPTSFLVVDDQGEWLKVMLPERPNGSTGFVRSSEFDTAERDEKVVVDRDTNTLQLVRDGNVVMETSVAEGSEAYPTPTGLYYVTDILDTGNDGGAYGPYAIGISAHSDVLTKFNGGDGQVGLHGTNNPDSIGKDVSHGCVRLDNDKITELAGEVELGTPVQIV